ncbi:MAG: ribbon-helix-helix domain-containing protein [Candidatus Diapherotrites archaeon]
MENVSLKLEAKTAREIEKGMREFHYSTKTEFLRDAIRSKLSALEQERNQKKAWEKLFAARGSLKGKGALKENEEFSKWREANDSTFAKELFKNHHLPD